MQINWFTFTAQIVNFLVLVWILKRLLYEPVVRAMQQREESIAARLQAAKDEQTRAGELQAEFSQRLEKLAHERDSLMADAAAEVKEWKQVQTQVARQEVEAVRSNWFRQLNREREAFVSEIQRTAGDHVLGVTRMMLQQLSGRELESCMVREFLNRLAELDDAETAEIRSALTDAKHRVEIQSGFELPPDLQRQISEAVSGVLQCEVEVRYVVDRALICGIELQAGSQKVSWSVRESLETLNEHFGQVLDAALASASRSADTGRSSGTDRPSPSNVDAGNGIGTADPGATDLDNAGHSDTDSGDFRSGSDLKSSGGSGLAGRGEAR